MIKRKIFEFKLLISKTLITSLNPSRRIDQLNFPCELRVKKKKKKINIREKRLDSTVKQCVRFYYEKINILRRREFPGEKCGEYSRKKKFREELRNELYAWYGTFLKNEVDLSPLHFVSLSFRMRVSRKFPRLVSDYSSERY